jgi:CIC family chloride channel protein
MRLAQLVDAVHARLRISPAMRPAIGGAAVGGLAIISPQALSAGHGALELNLSHPAPLAVLSGLIALKLAASALSVGSGFRGGLFFASLFLGALWGLAFAGASSALGVSVLDPGSAALAGIGALGAAVVGAPLTMAFLVLEASGDYPLTGVVLASTIAATLVMRTTFGYSFATWRLHLQGHSLRGAHDVGRLRDLTVGALMRRGPELVDLEMSVEAFCERYPLGGRSYVVAADAEGAYAGLVSLVDAHATQGGDARLSDLLLARETVLHPAEDASAAMRRFQAAQADELAVVEPGTGRVLGTLSEAYAVRRLAETLDAAHRDLTI